MSARAARPPARSRTGPGVRGQRDRRPGPGQKSEHGDRRLRVDRNLKSDDDPEERDAPQAEAAKPAHVLGIHIPCRNNARSI